MAEENRHQADESGLLLDRGRDAFRYRAALIGVAERSIDLQYYIWHDDRSGNYLADRVLQAAERGVRVRLLLDDFDAVGNDAVIPVLNAHPNIEVRVYNPFAQRRGLGRWLDLLVTGAVVSDIARGYDVYWNSERSYPLESLVEYPSSAGGLRRCTTYF